MAVVYQCALCTHLEMSRDGLVPVHCGIVCVRVTPPVTLSILYEKLESLEKKIDYLIQKENANAEH